METMHRLFAILAAIGLVGSSIGCSGHMAGVCDCDLMPTLSCCSPYVYANIKPALVPPPAPVQPPPEKIPAPSTLKDADK